MVGPPQAGSLCSFVCCADYVLWTSLRLVSFSPIVVADPPTRSLPPFGLVCCDPGAGTRLKFSLVELRLFLDCECSHEGAGRRDA